MKSLKRSQTRHSPIKKKDGSWARSQDERAETFAEHLSKVFKPNLREITQKEENRLLSNDTILVTQDIPIYISPFTEGMK